ncbi:MAG: hypothetical protein LQ349_006601 [Xanthoria aureola]|nr:MAG: hypothetical protein LQ349_006601 [Xanthoria aureola]
MEWPGYQIKGSRPQRRATQGSSSPEAQGYPSYPDYAAGGGYEYQQSMPYPPTAYVPNPLLAAYALPPPLPKLVNSRAKRPAQPIERERERYDRQTISYASGESPPPTARIHRHFQSRSSDVVADDARWDSGSDDGAVPDDEDAFDDSVDIALDSQGVRLHSAEPSPYIDTVERVLHSRFHGSTLDQEAVTAHLITEPQCKGSPSDIPNLFEWM